MDKNREGTAGVHQNIRSIFKDKKKPMKAWHVQTFYIEKFGKRYSESTITARFREMADVKCNLSTYTYTLES